MIQFLYRGRNSRYRATHGNASSHDRFGRYSGVLYREGDLFYFFLFSLFSLSLFRRRIYVPRCSTETSRKLRLRDCCRVCGFSFWRFLRSLCLFFFWYLYFFEEIYSSRNVKSCRVRVWKFFRKVYGSFFFPFKKFALLSNVERHGLRLLLFMVERFFQDFEILKKLTISISFPSIEG